jgi:hypothetical protein
MRRDVNFDEGGRLAALEEVSVLSFPGYQDDELCVTKGEYEQSG